MIINHMMMVMVAVVPSSASSIVDESIHILHTTKVVVAELCCQGMERMRGPKSVRVNVLKVKFCRRRERNVFFHWGSSVTTRARFFLISVKVVIVGLMMVLVLLKHAFTLTGSYIVVDSSDLVHHN